MPPNREDPLSRHHDHDTGFRADDPAVGHVECPCDRGPQQLTGDGGADSLAVLDERAQGVVVRIHRATISHRRQPGVNQDRWLPSVAVSRRRPVELTRTRLLERLGERWRVGVTVVRGSAGSGKSTLLRQARAQNEQDPRGLDVSVTLREGDADASRLLRRLADVLDLEIDPDSRQPALTIVDQIAVRSPAAICLHLDDVHRVGPESTGAELLRTIIDERPSNLTFVLASRGSLPIPLARRSATGDLVMIDGDTELFFDAEELVTLGYDPDDRLGWPVLLALDAAGRPGVRAGDFLFEEVASELGPQPRHVLGLLAGAGQLPAPLVEERYGAEVVDALTELPLIDLTDDGRLVAHDLWADALPSGDADLVCERGAVIIAAEQGDLKPAFKRAKKLPGYKWVVINREDLFAANPLSLGSKAGIFDADGNMLKNADVPRKKV